MSGDVQISLLWNNVNDLDLDVRTPSGTRIWYYVQQSPCGGEFDIDANNAEPRVERPVENIFWPTEKAPTGKYRVSVTHLGNFGGQDPTEFTVRIIVDGKTTIITKSIEEGQKLLIHEFTRGKAP